jgi:hypothetical protein
MERKPERLVSTPRPRHHLLRLVISTFAGRAGGGGRQAEEDKQKKEGCCRVLTLTSNA